MGAVHMFVTFMLYASPRSSAFHRRKGFPSSFWVGWKGLIQFHAPSDIEVRVKTCIWIIWYQRSSSGTKSPVWDLSSNGFPVQDLNYKGNRDRQPSQTPPSVDLQILTNRSIPNEDIPNIMPNLPYPTLHLLFYGCLHMAET
jgi:hypothetical protein